MGEYGSSMSWVATKLFIFCGVVGLVIFVDTRRNGVFNPEIIIAALMFGVIAYLLISLIKNIGFLGTVVAAIATGFGLDKLLKMGILTDESSFYVVLVAGVVFVLWDAWQVVQYFRYEWNVAQVNRYKSSKKAMGENRSSNITAEEWHDATLKDLRCPHCASRNLIRHMNPLAKVPFGLMCKTCNEVFSEEEAR